MQPIVLISSYPPRLCGIATFVEEAREFVQAALADRETHVICHPDGRGENVHPILDPTQPNWDEVVAREVKALNPYAVHIQHEYGLYAPPHENGHDGAVNGNRKFLDLLHRIRDYPTIVEPHTVHGRTRESEERFLRELTDTCSILLLKCDYQKWRMGWNFRSCGWPMPRNVTIIPHGARPDKQIHVGRTDQIKHELGLSHLIGERLAGLVGWIQSNKRWDIVADMWPEIYAEIAAKTGERWLLFAAGEMRDPNHQRDHDTYVAKIKDLEARGMASFYRFIPRGDLYYRVMAVCDFVILPTLDETQSGTLARIIALNKPYVTTAPLEGLTSQTIESDAGMLFTNRETLRRAVVQLATDEGLRWTLGENSRRYLQERVSWKKVAAQYIEAYELAAAAKRGEATIDFPPEF